jgi:putative transposase
VLLDIFSRSVPGWLVAMAENAALAERLIAETVRKEALPDGQLTIHADRGSSMAPRPVALLLADLASPRAIPGRACPTTTRFPSPSSRPSNTGRPFPSGSARSRTPAASAGSSSPGTTHEHRHSGIGLLTRAMVHAGIAQEVHAGRATVLADAYAAHPERFVRGLPRPPELPTAVWINPPAKRGVPTQ